MESRSGVPGWKKLGRGILRALLPFTFRKCFHASDSALDFNHGDLGV